MTREEQIYIDGYVQAVKDYDVAMGAVRLKPIDISKIKLPDNLNSIDKCTWKHDTDYEYYDTSCGEKLTFDAEWDEAEDLVKFCWHCGKPTEFVFWLRCKECDDKLEWGYRGKYCSLCEPEHESDLEVQL